MVIGHNIAVGGKHHAGTGALGDILPEEIAGRNAFGGDGHHTVLHPLHNVGIAVTNRGSIGGGRFHRLVQDRGGGTGQPQLIGQHGAAGPADQRKHQAAGQQQGGPPPRARGFFVCVRGRIPRSSRLLRLPGRGILMDAVMVIPILPVGETGIVSGKMTVVKIVGLVRHNKPSFPRGWDTSPAF